MSGIASSGGSSVDKKHVSPTPFPFVYGTPSEEDAFIAPKRESGSGASAAIPLPPAVAAVAEAEASAAAAAAAAVAPAPDADPSIVLNEIEQTLEMFARGVGELAYRRPQFYVPLPQFRIDANKVDDQNQPKTDDILRYFDPTIQAAVRDAWSAVRSNPATSTLSIYDIIVRMKDEAGGNLFSAAVRVALRVRRAYGRVYKGDEAAMALAFNKLKVGCGCSFTVQTKTAIKQEYA